MLLEWILWIRRINSLHRFYHQIRHLTVKRNKLSMRSMHKSQLLIWNQDIFRITAWWFRVQLQRIIQLILRNQLNNKHNLLYLIIIFILRLLHRTLDLLLLLSLAKKRFLVWISMNLKLKILSWKRIGIHLHSHLSRL